MITLDGQPSSSMRVKAPPLSSVDHTLTVISVPDAAPAGGTENTVDDSVFQSYNGVVNYGGIALVNNPDPSVGHFDFKSNNNNIATVDQNGVVRYVSKGVVGITATSVKGAKGAELYVYSQGSATTPLWVRYVSGCAALHASNMVDSRLAAVTVTPAHAVEMFSVRDDSASNYVRYANCWATGIDLTCMSVWNDGPQLGYRKSGAVLTPRHAITAGHFPFFVGDTVRYVTMDNQVVERTVIAAAHAGINIDGNLPWINYDAPMDWSICAFDSALPDTIKPAKVLPVNVFANYFPTILAPGDPPITPVGKGVVPNVATDQFRRLLVWEHYGINQTPTYKQAQSFVPPIDPLRTPFYAEPRPGDSGSPQFYIINNELVFMWPGERQVSHDTYGRNVLLDMMNTVLHGHGYSLSLVDLSSFPTY